MPNATEFQAGGFGRWSQAQRGDEAGSLSLAYG
jgi:hypothetical protein